MCGTINGKAYSNASDVFKEMNDNHHLFKSNEASQHLRILKDFLLEMALFQFDHEAELKAALKQYQTILATIFEKGQLSEDSDIELQGLCRHINASFNADKTMTPLNINGFIHVELPEFLKKASFQERQYAALCYKEQEGW